MTSLKWAMAMASASRTTGGYVAVMMGEWHLSLGNDMHRENRMKKLIGFAKIANTGRISYEDRLARLIKFVFD